MTIAMKTIEEFYEVHRDKLVKSFVRMMGSEAAAEDVVQDAFERIIRYRHKYDNDSFDMNAWVYVVTRNCARDALKKEKMVEGAQFDEFDFAAKPFRTDLLRMRRDVKAIIDSKGDNVADILNLFVFKELSAREIYDLTEYTAHQIKIAIYRFRKDMKELYERGK